MVKVMRTARPGPPSAAARLEARYRRLLRGYPPGRRRAELLGTLLEAAPAGRTRPTARETVNLLRHGLRARLGRPASHGVVVLAVAVLLVTGHLGAAVATRLAWEAAPGLPTGAALASIADTLFPATATSSSPSDTGLLHDPDGRPPTQVLTAGHDEDLEFTTLTIVPTAAALPGDYRAWAGGTRDRLTAAGWTIREAEATGPTDIATGQVDEDGRRLWATRSGLSLELEVQAGPAEAARPTGSFSATATVLRQPPWFVTALGILGWLLAALAGWLVTGWVSRRTERAGAVVRLLTREPVVVALVVLLPLALAGMLVFAVETFLIIPPYVPFWRYSVTYGYALSLPAALACLLSLVVTAVAARPATEPDMAPS